MPDGSTIGLASAFAAGLVSFVSPCVLPLVPAYVSYVAGHALDGPRPRADAGTRLAAAAMSAYFVLGFSVVFIVLGASATAAGRLLLQYRYEANLVGGVIVIVFGLLMMGFTRWAPWSLRSVHFQPRVVGVHPGSAFVLGLAFGFGWTPCIGPILGAILTLSAVQNTVGSGVGYLSAYALGLGVPFLLCAVFMRELAGKLKLLRRSGQALQIVAGVILVLMGVAMVTGQLSAFAFWLLNTFPVFGRIG
jgi:cytochrome c-type biogenesis protein